MLHKLAYKKLSLNAEKQFFCHEIVQSLEEIAQRDCRVSIHVDIKDLMGNGPQQL